MDLSCGVKPFTSTSTKLSYRICGRLSGSNVHEKDSSSYMNKKVSFLSDLSPFFLAADYFTINTILQIQSYKITFCLADKLDL
jgi:hypothetical protein